MWIFCVVEKEAKSQSNFYKEWRKAINETKLTKLPPLKPISKADKEHDLYDSTCISITCIWQNIGMKNQKAVEKMAKFLRWSKQMINNILKK